MPDDIWGNAWPAPVSLERSIASGGIPEAAAVAIAAAADVEIPGFWYIPTPPYCA